jgi:hypothetical protein
MSAAASSSSSSVSDDLVDDSLVSSHDIVADRGLTAASAKKGLSKDKEKALAEEAVDKVKAGAEERDEDNTEDSQLSISHSSRGKRQLLGPPSASAASVASSGDAEADLAAYLTTASDASIFADLSVRFEDTRAEADQTFVLLGDALLLQLLNDRLVQWSPSTWRTAKGAALGCGGQFLHVVWAFESELTRLCEGGRQCRVLWIDEVGEAVTALRPDYAALRRVLHLHVHLHCRLLQDSFANWWADDFAVFLERVDPAFLVVGDGHDSAYDSHPPQSTEGGGDEGSLSASLSPSSLMRSLTLFLLSRNFRCIRLSELSSTANGVFAFQYQMPIEIQHQLRKQPRIPQRQAVDDEKAGGGAEESTRRWEDIQRAVASLPSLPPAYPSARLALTCYALALSLSEETASALSTSAPLSKAVLLQSILLSSLPLSARHSDDAELGRRLSPQQPPLPFAPFLHRFFVHVDAALQWTQRTGQGKDGRQPPVDRSAIDLFDLRALLSTTDQLDSNKGPAHNTRPPSTSLLVSSRLTVPPLSCCCQMCGVWV